MGPRQDAGEDLPRCVTCRPGMFLLQWGPGRMPGKTNIIGRCRDQAQKLQWGPGRMPGKTRHAAGVRPCRRASMGPRQDAGEDAAQRAAKNS